MKLHRLEREQLVCADLDQTMWSHLHEFAAVPGGTLVRDEVLYARDLRRICDSRQSAIRRLLEPG